MVSRHARRVGGRNQGGESYRKPGVVEHDFQRKSAPTNYEKIVRELGYNRDFVATWARVQVVDLPRARTAAAHPVYCRSRGACADAVPRGFAAPAEPRGGNGSS